MTCTSVAAAGPGFASVTVNVIWSPTFGVAFVTDFVSPRSEPAATGVPPPLANSTHSCSLPNGWVEVGPRDFQPSLRQTTAACTISWPPLAA